MTQGFWENAYAEALPANKKHSNGFFWIGKSREHEENDEFLHDNNGSNSFVSNAESSGRSTRGGDQSSPVNPKVNPRLLESIDWHQAYQQSKQPSILKKIRDFLNEIWVNILLNSDEIPKAILVSSSKEGEGVTYISSHMALLLALEHDKKVLYVDTNINKKHKHVFDINVSNGLKNYLTGNVSIDSVIYKTNYDNLFVVPSGYDAAHPEKVIHMHPSKRLEYFVKYCNEGFDLVFYDGQAIVIYPEMISFAKFIDQFVMVCLYAETRIEVTKFVLDRLKKNKISIAGVVLNKREYPIPAVIYKYL